MPLQNTAPGGSRPSRLACAERDAGPGLAERLFKSFEQTSLEQPDPPLLDYLWLENHPTLMQRIVMAQRWRERQPSK